MFEKKPPTTWAKSEAKTLLENDLRDGSLAFDTEPKKAWLSRPEFQEFPLIKFRQNLYRGRDHVKMNHGPGE